MVGREIATKRLQPESRQRASTHVLMVGLLLVLNILAYVAIYQSGLERGFVPSVLLAMRDVSLFIPIGALFIWLSRRQGYAGDWTLLTVAVLLFGTGQFMQYRLFTDPEYAAERRDDTVRQVRQSKLNTIRQQNINDFYDADKKRVLFGDPGYQIPVTSGKGASGSAGGESAVFKSGYWTIDRILTSLSTLVPLLALAGFGIAFILTSRDLVLIRLQRYSLLIGLLTLLPFIFFGVRLSTAGKFIGETTPWEPVKLSFLISFAGILADNYRSLSRTRWGIPSWRFLLPLLMSAAMPVISFLALRDFGQLLVFLGVYLTLYLIAVKRLKHIALALLLVLTLLGVTLLGRGLYQMVTKPDDEVRAGKLMERAAEALSRGVPPRIHQRFYLWLSGEVPPDPREHWWWAEQKVRSTSDGELQTIASLVAADENVNEELWYNQYAFQPAQALFGISAGRLLGKGLGKGYPESVPIADSDFIYAALAEELGLIGGLLVLASFVLLVTAGVRTAIGAPDMFTKLLAAGVTSFLGLQALVNIGGVIKMLPMTGITLPFVSHGGWSLLTSFCMLGVLMAISHRNKMATSEQVKWQR